MTPALKRRDAAPSVDIQLGSPLWDAQPSAEQTVRDAIAAAAGLVAAGEGEVSVVLTNDEAIRALNRDWRKIDKPTNVLSFPAPDTSGHEKMFGDIVIAYETLARECDEEDRNFSDHLAHLSVHGFLHLIGYDHQTDSEADAMEALESKIMIAMKRPDPYLGAILPLLPIWVVPDTMPDSDSNYSGGAAYDARNLPVVLKPAGESGNWFVRTFRSLFGLKPGSIRSDLRDVLEDMPPGETGFSPEESRMLKNILGLRERRVGDVMVPRADIIAVHQDIQIGELVRVFESAEHSRLVVYDDTLDDPIGMVHIRDLIAYMTAHAAVDPEKNKKRKKPLPAGLDFKTLDLAMPLSAAAIVREILFVPPSARVIELLERMQAKQIHLALVVDEYGGTDGIVSIEDIVEQIVGEIADEHDDDAEVDVIQQPDGSYIADARAKIEDVVHIVGKDFDIGDAADEVDTLGGYLVSRAGRLPLRGQIIPGPAMFEFEVLDADPRRVKRVRIIRLKERRDKPRDTKKRDEPDAILAGTTPPTLPLDDMTSKEDLQAPKEDLQAMGDLSAPKDDMAAPKESAGPLPRSTATKRRP